MTVEVIVLGVAQDAGVPQAGSLRGMSLRAWADPSARQMATCLGLVHRASQRMWMIDATPDFKWQWHLLQTHAPECKLAGIFISHCHIGHYTGLIHLGKEAWNTAKMPLIATPGVLGFLRNNGPWGQLFTNGNVEGVVLDNAPFELTDDATLSVMRVPHRGEYSDTVAYSIRSKQRGLFFCPDIDRWEEWGRDVRNVVATHDVSLLDGSFFSGEELPGRDMSKIPHPIVTHTATVLKGVQRDVRFIHLNHTNPLLDETSPQREWLRAQGFGVARQGETMFV